MAPNWEELGRELTRSRGSRKAAPVARAVGISPTQLRNYERAIATSGRPPMERLIALANHYGVDAAPWLDLAGYDAGSANLSIASGNGSASHVALSPEADTVPVIEERKGEVSGRNVVKVRFAALGVEVETTYTDDEDRAAVLHDIMQAVGLGEFDGQGDRDGAY